MECCLIWRTTTTRYFIVSMSSKLISWALRWIALNLAKKKLYVHAELAESPMNLTFRCTACIPNMCKQQLTIACFWVPTSFFQANMNSGFKWKPTMSNRNHRFNFPNSICIDSSSQSQAISDGQGFENPQGYVGKGMKGQGRGKDFPTPTKPLPLTGVWGLPTEILRGKLRTSYGCFYLYKF